MAAHDLLLLVVQKARLVQNCIGDAQLADIVQQGAATHLHELRIAHTHGSSSRRSGTTRPVHLASDADQYQCAVDVDVNLRPGGARNAGFDIEIIFVLPSLDPCLAASVEQGLASGLRPQDNYQPIENVEQYITVEYDVVHRSVLTRTSARSRNRPTPSVPDLRRESSDLSQISRDGSLIEEEPIETQLTHRLGKLFKIHGLDNVAVHP